ncbi:MAG: C25 family cysteine peptidase [bacterium]
MRKRPDRRIQAAIVGAICTILLLFAHSQASVLTRALHLPAPEITYRDGFCVVALEDAPSLGNPGEPLLPVYSLQVLLPQGEDVTAITADISRIEEIRIGHPVACAQGQFRLSRTAPLRTTLPDETIYGGGDAFPAARAVHVTTQTCRGYNIAFINVYPIVYVPAEKKLLAARDLEIVVETSPSTRMLSRSMQTLRVHHARDAAVVDRLVDDSGAAATYTVEAPFPVFSGLVDPDETYPYVIITNYFFRTLFEPLKAYKDSTGLKTKIVHLGDINANYPGADIEEKTRNFIKDAYANWETEYVLLGADREWIRPRGLFATAAGDSDLDIASDLYYAALDGNWNDDGDAYWGEPGEEDLIPEVSLGRLAVGDSAQVVDFVNKILKYERSPVAGQVETAAMLGEIISGGTYGADYMNEMRDGSSANGYTTAGLDGGFVADSLYDRDFYPAEWDKDDLVPLLNSGRHLVNHIGHCNLYNALKMDNDDADTSFTNDGVTSTYFILYTQGCYAGAFDNRDTDGSQLQDDCIAEHITFNQNGAVAFIGNTRYGYYSSGNTRGASQYFNRQFYDAIFDEGITAIGRANDDSRVDNISLIEFEAMRWVYYTLTLLGDPSMDIWTATPDSLAVTHPDTVFACENEIAIDVSDGFGPVEGARVSLFTDDTFSLGFTGSAGTCEIDPLTETPGELYISVTAHNFYSYLDTITVVTSEGPLVTFEGFTTDDDTTGASSGNSNSEVDAGETIESIVTLRNAGQDTAYYVTALLSTASPYVSLIDSTGIYGDIPPDSVNSPSWSFAYSILPGCPDGETLCFDLSIDHDDTTVVRTFEAAVHAPVLSVAGISTADTLYGDANGCLEASETFELALDFKNVGSGLGAGIAIEITENDPYVTLDVDSAYIDTLAADSTRTASPAYLITLAPDCPEFHEINLGINIAFESGRQLAESTTIYVGGWLEDDFEGGDRGWTHINLWPTYEDEWHIEDYRNHTGGGTYSWKSGGEDSVKYSNYSYGALVSPELCLSGDATMTFWQYIEVEMISSSVAWDGGIVEISTDGGETWAQIAPVGGYPDKIYGDSHCPFAKDTPCFGTTSGWEMEEFDLSAYEGSARIRFVFGSGSIVGEEGWYIDDIDIVDDLAGVDDPRATVPGTFRLHAMAPNPVISGALVAFDVPATSRVKVEIFNVEGRVVETIANSTFEPGRYSIDWKPGLRLAPGVYFLNMETPTFSQTRKVIIVR